MKIVILLILITCSLSLRRVKNLPKCVSTIANAKTVGEIKGGDSGTKWDSTCDASVNVDFATRDKLPEYTDCTPGDSWGPQPNVYPGLTEEIPLTCSRSKWLQTRVIELLKKFTSKGWNYCHHHSPSWPTPPTERTAIDPANIAGDGGSSGVCSAAGISGDKGWNGIDCTHFTSWIYNYGFGAHLVSLTGDQACGTNAPGRALPFTAAQQDQFLPGDILFIAKKSGVDAMAISHGILWTGIKVTDDEGPFSYKTLIENVPANQKDAVAADYKAAKAAKKDVYVIADSHNKGPAYRMFAGWWSRAFTFARRLLDAPTTYPEVAPGAVFADKVCTYTKPKK